MTVQRVTEAVTATATPKGPGRVLLTIITPGQGSSGYYTPEVLERAATERVFGAHAGMAVAVVVVMVFAMRMRVAVAM